MYSYMSYFHGHEFFTFMVDINLFLIIGVLAARSQVFLFKSIFLTFFNFRFSAFV